MDLAAHSILDPSGKLLAVCPDKEIAREIAETFCIITDLNYTYREANPDELREMLAKPDPRRDPRFQIVVGVGQQAVLIPTTRHSGEPVDN